MINLVWQLTRSGWAPIAKISFMTYLVHMDIQFTFFRMQASYVTKKNIYFEHLSFFLSGVPCGLDNADKRPPFLRQPGRLPALWLRHLDRLGTSPCQASEDRHGCPCRSHGEETVSKVDPCPLSALHQCSSPDARQFCSAFDPCNCSSPHQILKFYVL